MATKTNKPVMDTPNVNHDFAKCVAATYLTPRMFDFNEFTNALRVQETRMGDKATWAEYYIPHVDTSKIMGGQYSDKHELEVLNKCFGESLKMMTDYRPGVDKLEIETWINASQKGMVEFIPDPIWATLNADEYKIIKHDDWYYLIDTKLKEVITAVKSRAKVRLNQTYWARNNKVEHILFVLSVTANDAKHEFPKLDKKYIK